VYSNLRKKKRWGKGGRYLASLGKKRKGGFGCSSHASRQVLDSDFDRTTTGCFKGAVGIYFDDDDVVFYRRGRIGRITRGGVVEGGDDDEGVGER